MDSLAIPVAGVLIARIGAIFRERIATCPGITSITYWDLTFDRRLSHLSLEFRAVTTEGEELVATSASGDTADEDADFAQLMNSLLIRIVGSIS